ncbi:MAG: exopolysaccharide biosynthesis protein [Microvirga sp.]
MQQEQVEKVDAERGARDPSAHKSVSAVLRSVVDGAEGESLTVARIIEAFGERAFGLVLILFSLPNSVPAVPPGVAGVFGTPVLLFGIQMLLGHKRPWLPKSFMRREIPLDKFRRLIDVAEPKLQWLERFCKPRLTQLFGVVGDRAVGLLAVLVAICVLIPFPGTNIPPSAALVIVSLAVIEEDGYLLILGSVIAIAGIAYTATVLGASYHLIRAGLAGWFGI